MASNAMTWTIGPAHAPGAIDWPAVLRQAIGSNGTAYLAHDRGPRPRRRCSRHRGRRRPQARVDLPDVPAEPPLPPLSAEQAEREIASGWPGRLRWRLAGAMTDADIALLVVPIVQHRRTDFLAQLIERHGDRAAPLGAGVAPAAYYQEELLRSLVEAGARVDAGASEIVDAIAWARSAR
jgi:hypothetical protein